MYDSEFGLGGLASSLERPGDLGAQPEFAAFGSASARLSYYPFDQSVYGKPAGAEDQYDQRANEKRERVRLHKFVRIAEDACHGF